MAKLKVVSFPFLLENRQIGLFSNGRQESKEAGGAEVLLSVGLAKSFGHQRPAGRGQRRDLRLKRVSFWDGSILMLHYSNALAFCVEFNISENSPSCLLVNNLNGASFSSDVTRGVILQWIQNTSSCYGRLAKGWHCSLKLALSVIATFWGLTVQCKYSVDPNTGLVRYLNGCK